MSFGRLPAIQIPPPPIFCKFFIPLEIVAAISVKYCNHGTYRQVLLKKEVRRDLRGLNRGAGGRFGEEAKSNRTCHRSKHLLKTG